MGNLSGWHLRTLLDGSLPSSNSSHVPRPVFDTKHFHLRLKTEQQDFCSKSEMIFPPWSTLIIGCLKLYSPALQCSELLVSRLLFNSSLNPLKVMIKSAAVVSWSLLFFNSTLNSLRKSAAGSSGWGDDKLESAASSVSVAPYPTCIIPP